MQMKDDTAVRIKYSYSSPEGLLPMDSSMMASFLPVVRPGRSRQTGRGISYRAYLESIQRLIFKQWDLFAESLAEQGWDREQSITEIDLIAEKHGSDYHPARVRVVTPDRVLSFVMNVALTERGKERAEQEFHALQELDARFGRGFVPRVYFLDSQGFCSANGQAGTMTMFLGDWLERYYEFHLSAHSKGSSPRTVVWDTDLGHGFVSWREAEEIFRQAASVLTSYYDTDTFEEIFPWHHASGDFVVGRPDGVIDVKLISVRQYARRVVFTDDSPENAFRGLLLFFANLTLRMRLDRFDGVGEIAWAGDHCVEGTIRGFLDAIQTKAHEGHCDHSLPGQFMNLIRAMSPGELAEVFFVVIESYDKNAPDMPVIRAHAVDHIHKVYQVVQALPSFF
jgi:hypothetical protein